MKTFKCNDCSSASCVLQTSYRFDREPYTLAGQCPMIGDHEIKDTDWKETPEIKSTLPTYEDSEAKVHYRYDRGEGANAIERFVCEYEPVMDDMERKKWREMLAAAISDYLPQGKGVEP